MCAKIRLQLEKDELPEKPLLDFEARCIRTSDQSVYFADQMARSFLYAAFLESND
jgi:hypothetical protein